MTKIKLVVAAVGVALSFGSAWASSDSDPNKDSDENIVSCVKLGEAKYVAKTADFTPFFMMENAPTVRVIIAFHDKLDDRTINSLVPGRVIHHLRMVNAIAAEVPVAALDMIAKSPDVRAVEIDGQVKAFDLTQSFSPEPAPAKQFTPPGIIRTHAPEAWATTKGKGVTVAIIDTGIDKTHPDLEGRIISGQNYTSENRNDWGDGQGHGTHVSGTVAANNNNIGVVGMAPEAQLMAVRVLDDSGSGTYSDVVAGVEYAATSQAKVANMSLGGTRDVQTLHDALKKAHENGIFVAAAAGNSGDYDENPINFPAAYPEVVSTAAVDDKDQRAYFSTFNKFVALSGPGVDVFSLDKGGAYARHSGTSMASPHVAGAAALIRAAFPDESIVDFKRRVVCNADELFPVGRNVWTGHGILNVQRSLAQAAPASCDYLKGEVAEPAPVAKPKKLGTPSRSTPTIFVKSTALSLVNDGEHKQLVVTVKLVNEKRVAQPGLKVTSQIMERVGGPLGQATATTNAQGEAQFVLTGFTCGKYITQVNAVSNPLFSLRYGQPSAELDL